MARKVYERVVGAQGVIAESKPVNKYDRRNKPKEEKPEEQPELKNEFRDKLESEEKAADPERFPSHRPTEEKQGGTGIPVIKPEDDGAPVESVYILQATNYHEGQVIPSVIGAFTKEKLDEYLTDKGAVVGANGLVYPIYRVQKVWVKK